MAGNQAGKSKNEAMSGLLSDREYRRHERDLMRARGMAARGMADYVHYKCDICHSRRNHHVPKKEAPYTYDFGKWMAKQQGTPGALEQ